MKEMKKHLYTIVLVIITIISYYYKIFFYNISIDTERIINNKNAIYLEWIGLYRPGLVIFKKITELIPFNIQVTNVVVLFILIITVKLWCKLFRKIFNKKNELAEFAFCAIIISSPIFAEQFNFSLQCLEISIALLLNTFAFYKINKYFEENKSIDYIISILLLIFIFSCYQSFIFLYITIALFFILTHDTNNFIERSKVYLKIFLSSVICYVIVIFVFKNIFYINETSNYFQNNYLSSFKIIYSVIYVMYLVLGCDFFYSNIFFIPITYFFIYTIKNNFKFGKRKFIFNLYILIFVISPFILTLIVGFSDVARARFAYVYFIALIVYYIIMQNHDKLIKNIIIIIVTITIIFQTFITLGLFYNDYLRYKEDVLLANELNEKLQNSNKPLIFLGKYKTKTVLVKGEVLGHSFFEWDYNTEFGVTQRATGFLNALGYDYKCATLESIKEAKHIYNTYKESSNYMIIETENNIIVIFK